MKTSTFNINGMSIVAEYYTKSVNDKFIYLYNNYEKLSLSIKFYITCKDYDAFRNFYNNNRSNSSFKLALSIYNTNKNLLRRISILGTEIFSKFGSISSSIEGKEVIITTSSSLDDSTFTRGETFLTAIQLTDYTDNDGSNADATSSYSRNFIVNTFPTFKTSISNLQCFAVYGVDNQRYTDDDGFINSFEFSNIPDIVKSSHDASMISIYYCLKKNGQSSYGGWIKLQSSNPNSLNILTKDTSGNYQPLYFKMKNIISGLSRNDKVKFAVFAHTENEINLNVPNWISGEYFKKVPTTLNKPVIENITNNAEYPNISYSYDGSTLTVISPIVSKDNDYLKYYDDIAVEIQDNLSSTWYPCTCKKVMKEGPTYECETDKDGNIILDDNGDPVLKKDSNGNYIVVKPAVWDYIFDCNLKYSDIGSYTVTPRVRVQDTNLIVVGDKITFSIFENILIYPVITYYTDNDSTIRELTTEGYKSSVPVYINYKDDDRFSSLNIFEQVKDEDGNFNWVFLSRNQEFTEFGEHLIKAEGIIKRTGDTSSIIRSFTISNELPQPIIVDGVTDYDNAEYYKIRIQRDSTSTIEVYYTKDNDDTHIIPDLIRETDDDNITWYTFNITETGLYNLYITATHNFSGMTRSKVITAFTVSKGEISSNIIDFNPSKPPVHSTIMSLYPTTTENKLFYWLDEKIEGKETKYLSPLIILRNLAAYAREISGSLSVDESKTFNGIVHYTPEEPSIVDVSEGSVYYTPRHIKFINNASKPDQAEYIVFLDGKQLENPFEGSYEVTQSGYHYIFIVGWDNVRPIDYIYKELKFLMKAEDSNSLRKPGIIFGKEDENGEVTITFNFSALHPDVTHTVTITYNDGTIERFTYPYNIGTVILKVKKNCTVTAESKYNSTNFKESNTVKIDYIYEKEPRLEDIKVLGLTKKEIYFQTKNPINVNIGPVAWLLIPMNGLYTYDIYVNGYPYKMYSEIEDENDTTYGKDAHFREIIRNQQPELRKYRIEIIVKNKHFPDKESYYYNEFILDSLEFAFPKLESLRKNVMNRTGLPTVLHEKHEENVNELQAILNSRLTDIRTYLITKDDEYILTMSYYYYTGSIRTSSFYFSINSNAIDELKPLRLVLKVKDFQDVPNYDYYIKNGLEPEAKDGEFIIDRQTGHLYFGSKNGTTKVDIVPITKDLELISNEAEEYFLNCDNILNEISYFKETCEEALVFYEKRLSEFVNKVNEYEKKLNSVASTIDQIKSDMDRLHEELTGFEKEILNNTEYIADTLSSTIEEDTKLYKELNDNFETLVSETLRKDFHRASVVKDDSYWLKEEIAKKVTTKRFEEWKSEEEAKYKRFTDACTKFFGR